MSDVSQILRHAHEAVVASGVPEPFQQIAFREAMRILAPSPTSARSAPGAGAAAPGGESTSDQPAPNEWISEAELYNRVANHTDASKEKLELLVHLDEGVPHISIAGMKLGKSNAERTRTVAQVLAVVRGFGLDEEATDLQVIRDECMRLKVYDAGNFSSYLSKLPGFVISGSGANRKVRARGQGIQAFADLVNDLVSA